jgi:hypothetical protein
VTRTIQKKFKNKIMENNNAEYQYYEEDDNGGVGAGLVIIIHAK